MAIENKLVRIDVPAIAASTSNGEAVLKRIQDIRQNQALPFVHKRQLVRAEVAGLMKARKNEIDARLEIQELKLSADVAAAGRAIAIYRNTVITQMDDEFNKFVESLGTQVAVKRLNLLKALAERLTGFERSLNGRNIDKRFVAKILQKVDQTFDDMSDQIGGHIAGIAVPSDDQQK